MFLPTEQHVSLIRTCDEYVSGSIHHLVWILWGSFKFLLALSSNKEATIMKTTPLYVLDRSEASIELVRH